jgi:hypothetical protein
VKQLGCAAGFPGCRHEPPPQEAAGSQRSRAEPTKTTAVPPKTNQKRDRDGLIEVVGLLPPPEQLRAPPSPEEDHLEAVLRKYRAEPARPRGNPAQAYLGLRAHHRRTQKPYEIKLWSNPSLISFLEPLSIASLGLF